MSPKRKSAGQKAAATRKRNAAKRRSAAKKAVLTRTRRAAGRKAAKTRMRRAAGRKAVATRTQRKKEEVVALQPVVESATPQPVPAQEPTTPRICTRGGNCVRDSRRENCMILERPEPHSTMRSWSRPPLEAMDVKELRNPRLGRRYRATGLSEQ